MDERIVATAQHAFEQSLLSQALDALREKTDIQGTLVQRQPQPKPQPKVSADDRADAWVDLAFDGKAHRYIVECKNHVDRKAQLDQIDLGVGSSDRRSCSLPTT